MPRVKVNDRVLQDARDAGIDALMASADYQLVTPSDDDNDNFEPCRGLWVGTAGAATLIRPDGTTATDFPLKAGYNPVSCIRVATGATASGIWRL
jgi:hypothetical protein